MNYIPQVPCEEEQMEMLVKEVDKKQTHKRILFVMFIVGRLTTSGPAFKLTLM